MPKMSRSAGLLLLISLMGASPLRADVILTPLEGEPIRGISLALDKNHATIHSSEGEVQKTPVAEVVSITVVPAPAVPAPGTRPFEVELACGSRLRGTLRSAQEDFIRLQSPTLQLIGGGIKVEIENVRSLRRVAGAKVPGAARLVRIPETDTVYTIRGARVKGTVARFGPAEVEVRRGENLGDRKVRYAELAAVFFDVEKQAGPEQLHLSARLIDGSRLVLSEFRVEGGVLVGKTPTGYRFRIPLGRVASLGLRGGSFVHVSDLKPTAVNRKPFFAIPKGPAAGAMLEFLCPVRTDRSPDGHPIRLRGRLYDKGIGVRPRTELTYKLGKKYRRFDALCGIDDEVLGAGYGRGAGTGSVVFRVLLDGKEVFRSRKVLGGRAPVRIRIPVADKNELTLIVDLVPDALMPKGKKDSAELDNAVWAQPLLVK